MPVIPWNTTFSDTDPGPKQKLFFEGSTSRTITVARTRTSHQGAAPKVSIATLRTGTSLPEDHDLPEDDTQVLEGVKCVGVADAPDRRPGETVAISVSATW
jgi:hypothetical protein